MRLRAIRQGEWPATVNFAGVAGFFINCLHSPWTPLAEAASEFLQAKNLPEQLRVFVNTYLGETWEVAGEQVDSLGLYERREDYGGDNLPEGVVVITAGVDIQDDRIELEWSAGAAMRKVGISAIMFCKATRPAQTSGRT